LLTCLDLIAWVRWIGPAPQDNFAVRATKCRRYALWIRLTDHGIDACALVVRRKLNGITPKSFDDRCEWVIDLFERLSTPGRQV